MPDQTYRENRADGAAPAKRRYASAFLDHLVRNRIISEKIAGDVSDHIQEQKGNEKRRMVDILAEEYEVSKDVLARELAQFYSFRIIDSKERSLRRLDNQTILKLVEGLAPPAYRVVMRHKVLPFETAEGQPDKLLVVTPNPTDREVSEAARAFPYAKHEICYMKEADWDEFWQQVSQSKSTTSLGAASAGNGMFEENDSELDSALEREIDSSQLINLVNNIFTDAVRIGASDIHIVPKGSRKTEISFRIDGELTTWYTVEDTRAEAVVAVVKGRGLGLDRFERMAAQDGQAQKVVDDQVVRFRMSVLPIISKEMAGKFESMVIRILKDAHASVSLESIGLDPYSLEMFREAINKPHGIVILTGPTGSGKSTTLVAALRSVMNPSVCTITVEDPVEYLIEGARQVKLNHKLSFDDAIRAILRHDPDIIMVGEIRDRATADIAIKLANTGHLTFSTLHTNDAASVVSRLFKIGVEPFLIAQALNIVVAQRLVRKLCEKCKRPVHKNELNHTMLVKYGFEEADILNTVFFEPVGCPHCVGGFKGRSAIHETLYISPEIREIIIDSGEKIDLDAIQRTAIKHGMRTLRQSGLELAKQGVSSIDEVVNATTRD
ncbi:MAG: type II/IV secretion system protein [Bacteroidetes bacterium]|nr:type II/IV secretion system protein [Bacteroidota bacterium]MCW5894985.1 type II/IV secretion system protein [Bacteroidota bacterium]